MPETPAPTMRTSTWPASRTSPLLRWDTGAGAVVVVGVLLGGTLGQPQDFSGPQAKPHRMFVLTVALLLAPFLYGALAWGLAIIAAGTVVTIARRLSRLSAALRG